jgi:hypothetical protein
VPNSDIFQQVSVATSGSLSGDFLWSNPANWEIDFPANGDNVLIGSIGYDDLPSLSLATLQEDPGGVVRVTGGDLNVGVVLGGDQTELSASGASAGATTPVIVTIGTIVEAGGLYTADGATSAIVDNAATDPGATYIAENGGTVALAAAPAATSVLSFGTLATGTIALDNPAATNAGLLADVAVGDVLELPGSSVAGVSFGASTLTVTTSDGSFAFNDVSYTGTILGDAASFDATTGLEAIGFAGADTFQPVAVATSGSLAGFYLWSNPANWTDGVPIANDSVTVAAVSVDDLAALSLVSLTETGSGQVSVVGDLNVGTVVATSGSRLLASGIQAGATTPVDVTVGSVTGTGALLGAVGPASRFVDDGSTDPGATYSATDGGTVVLSAPPVTTSALAYSSTVDNFGTFALLHPNPTIVAPLMNVAPGDVIELPGTSFIAAGSSADLTTVTTSAGTYSFAAEAPNAFVASSLFASFDATTGLEAISFTGPPETFQEVAVGTGVLGSYYTWSNPANWTTALGANGIPVNGDSVTESASGAVVDDLPSLSLTSLTTTGGGDVLVPDGVLTIGTLTGGTGTGLAALGQLVGATAPVIVTVGTVIGSGGQYVSFGSTSALVFDAPTDPGGTYLVSQGGTLVLSAPPSGTSLLEYFEGNPGTIALRNPGTLITAPLQDISPGDVLELPGSSVSSVNFGPVSLTVTTSAGSYDFRQYTEANLANSFSARFDPATGLEAITFGLLCFCEGSLIRTPSGDLPVERLAVGDTVVTSSGAPMPITWIGQGRVRATPGRRSAATPIVVRKGALGDNVPFADLRVTKGHSLFIDGVLIPAEFLVNHRSIAWDDRAREVAIYHVELATHDVLLANGAPAESYRDDGNRWLFRNANSGWNLPPPAPCAPVLTGGPIVDALWRRLLDRAGPRPSVPVTDDPDLHLLVDGRRLDVRTRHGDAYVFRLRTVPHEARIISRASAPAELGIARDPRVLGIALRRIEAWQGQRPALIEADDGRLKDGFHQYEAEQGLRWTQGDAAIPHALFASFDGPLELVLRLAGRTRYQVLADPTMGLAA